MVRATTAYHHQNQLQPLKTTPTTILQTTFIQQYYRPSDMSSWTRFSSGSNRRFGRPKPPLRVLVLVYRPLDRIFSTPSARRKSLCFRILCVRVLGWAMILSVYLEGGSNAYQWIIRRGYLFKLTLVCIITLRHFIIGDM